MEKNWSAFRCNYLCQCTASYYHPQRSCEGYVFTGVSVHRGGTWSRGSAWSGGVPGPRGGYLVPGGGVLGPSWGVCSRGMPGPGGVCSWGVVSQHALRQPPPEETASAADGTHPTGMHSSSFLMSCQFQDCT